MRTRTVYTCTYCNTDYEEKEKAIECENNHKLLETATIVGEYKPQILFPDGIPIRIKVKFKGSDEWIPYHRDVI